jgi:hypothetical protein
MCERNTECLRWTLPQLIETAANVVTYPQRRKHWRRKAHTELLNVDEAQGDTTVSEETNIKNKQKYMK